MSVETMLFWLFAILTCGGAVSVAVSQNVVRMAFSLVLCLGSTAVMFLLLGADFVGATQLMVYVGGTVVLLVFGVMLTATGPFTKIKSSGADAILSGLIGVIFLFIISTTVTAVDWGDISQKVAIGTHQKTAARGFNPEQQGNTTRPLGLSFLSVRADRDLNLSRNVPSVEKPVEDAPKLSSGYLLPFEIVSIHLLVVLVGASYLARAKRRVATNQ
ncbi:MAG: NADH-quinone oxidoreductase subunit J [Planctomycetia bacterium]|nr:NADH-quinone oxidoreductase subunit J [Planctomycetia bacterium]